MTTPSAPSTPEVESFVRRAIGVRFEMRFKGGFGVMFDDLLAAGYTLLVLALAKRFLFP